MGRLQVGWLEAEGPIWLVEDEYLFLSGWSQVGNWDKIGKLTLINQTLAIWG